MRNARDSSTDAQGQVGINAAAQRWLAGILDGWGLDDVDQRAEWIVRELLAQGVRPVPAPPPITGPGADADHRIAMKAQIDAALEAARRRRQIEEAGRG